MSLHIRAHFDGRVFVPDQPVDLPINQPLDLEVTSGKPNGVANGEAVSPEAIQERLRKLREIGGKFNGPVLSDEALRRENLYDERM